MFEQQFELCEVLEVYSIFKTSTVEIAEWSLNMSNYVRQYLYRELFVIFIKPLKNRK